MANGSTTGVSTRWRTGRSTRIRDAPCYGEDNVRVLTELRGRTPSEVERLAEEGVI
jgi:hypothetical protein